MMDWSCVDYLWIIGMFFYQLFRLSFWRHPFTAEDPLVNNWFFQICSDLEENKLIHISMLGKFPEKFHFWVNYLFKNMQCGEFNI